MSSLPKSSLSKRARRVYLIAACLFGLLISVFGITLYHYTKIQQIRIVAVGESTPVYGSDGLYGVSFFETTASIERRLKENNRHIKQLLVLRRWPNELTIMTVARRAVAQISTDGGVFYLDEEGVILKRTRLAEVDEKEMSAFPDIQFYQRILYDSYQVGDTLPFREIIHSLAILTHMRERESLDVVHIAISSQNVIRCSLRNATITFAADRSVEEQGYVLRQLLKQFRTTGRTFQSIDLRFDKPVVVF